MHVLHPLLVWREAREELEQPDFWAQYDIPQIVGGAIMLDVRNMGLGLRRQEQEQQLTELHLSVNSHPLERGRTSCPVSLVEIHPPAVITLPLSSSLETVHAGADTPVIAIPARLKVSLTDMVATSIALRSGLDVEIIDASPAWTSALFPNQPRTRSPSQNDRDPSQLTEDGELPATPAQQQEFDDYGDGTIPPHVAQAISGLQREVILLKNDLNLELWTARENVKHIGRLYTERVLSRNEEVERQGLVSAAVTPVGQYEG